LRRTLCAMDLFFLWQGGTLNEALSRYALKESDICSGRRSRECAAKCCREQGVAILLSVREVKEERGAKTSAQAL